MKPVEVFKKSEKMKNLYRFLKKSENKKTSTGFKKNRKIKIKNLYRLRRSKVFKTMKKIEKMFE